MSQHTGVAGRTRAAVAKEVVEAMHDLGGVIAMLIHEFTDPIDKAALRDALQLVIDVAVTHDELGGYRIYPAFGAEDAETITAYSRLAAAESGLLDAFSHGEPTP